MLVLLSAGCLLRNPDFGGGTEGIGGDGTTTGGCAALDADGDGVCDDADACPAGDDALDADGDGRPDACDPCPQDPADDADGDGLCGDVDACPDGDEDGDGVCDGVDVCPGWDDRKDSDGDGTPDGCETCDGDADGDGVCDAVDACPGSPDTLDADADGAPDACDPCPQDADNDGDGDGTCGDVDNCPVAANPGQADADGDGAGDACDVCGGQFSQDGEDYDGDGIPCAEDTCLFDGPTPPTIPGTVGPYTEITLSNARINGGTNFGTVSAGASFEVKFDWSLFFTECDGCAAQGIVGIGGILGSKCFYNMGDNGNNMQWQDTATMQFTAPAQPGTYVLRFSRHWRNYCPDNVDVGAKESTFAAICVP